MSIHQLKTLPEFYKAIECGDKTFEVRKNDREFKQGDILILQEFVPPGPASFAGRYTGNTITAQVTYLLGGGQFGIEPGYCVMGIKVLSEVEV